MSKKAWLGTGLIFGVSLGVFAERPNVVFLIADDLSAEALGCYGNSVCTTPHIDRLASRGIRFTRAYCQFPVCGPSRAALMSGLYPQRLGVMGNGASDGFTRHMGERPSMSEVFKNAGWHTARVSKIYHMRVPGDITAGVDGPDHAASWSERHNCQGPEWMSEGKHALPTSQRVRKEPDVHYNLGFGNAFYIVRGSTDGTEQPDVQAAAKAAQIIRENKDRPFFLAVGFVRPHVPLVAPEVWYAAYGPDRVGPSEVVAGDLADIPKKAVGLTTKGLGMADKPEAVKEVLGAYYASVSFMDAQVGTVLQALDDAGVREKTIVVFCSDHGYHLGEHGMWQKMNLHEESARIPLVIEVPGMDGGHTRSALVEQIDLYPTLVSLAGLPVPAHCQGANLMPVMKQADHRVRDAAYVVNGRGALLRTERWAYMRFGGGKKGGGEEVLYDMENDPKQVTNVVRNPDVAPVLEKLRKQLARKQGAVREGAGPAP